jgi:hypothetical protein
MRIKTPLGLFVTIVGVGLIPAAGVGGVIGVANTNYNPIPQPSSSAEVNENFGTKPEGRVESVKPTARATTQVKPTTVKVYKTPHAREDTSDVQNRLEAPEKNAEPDETEVPDDRPTKPTVSPTPREDLPKTADPVKSPPGSGGGTGEPVTREVAPKNS